MTQLYTGLPDSKEASPILDHVLHQLNTFGAALAARDAITGDTAIALGYGAWA